MNVLAFALFWIASGLLVWVYVVYPLLARGYGRLRPVRLAPNAQLPGLVTVGLAVHDGAGEIDERVADILSQAVPFELEVIVASDGSRDALAAVVRRLAQRDPRIRLLELPRAGQSAAQNAVFESAHGAVVVLTDLETRFAPGCLAALVAPFGDPRVGCTTGILRWRHNQATDVTRHEDLYWRYEQAVRAWESRAGWLAAGTGALMAVRRSLYRRVPAHASLDQMLPLVCREHGSFVLVAGGAGGTDRGTASLADQLTSRTRIATQGIEANLRMSLRIMPWRRPGSFIAIWSHKILRWATPYLALLSVLGGLGLWLEGGSLGYVAPAGLAMVVALGAVMGYLGGLVRRPLPLTGFALTVVAVNVAFALAWINVLLRRRVGSWEPGSD